MQRWQRQLMMARIMQKVLARNERLVRQAPPLILT
jgi:hypothetical protein